MSAEDEELQLAYALSLSTAEEEARAREKSSDPSVKEILPDQVTGAKLRSLSMSRRRSARRHSYDLRDDQEGCHRIPNKILVNAYNSTTSQEIKKDIVAFNLSTDNLFAGTNNKDHSEMERAFDGDIDDIYQDSFNQKSGMMRTALHKATKSGEYSPAFFDHLLEKMAAASPVYQKFIATEVDKRWFRGSPAVKGKIDFIRALYEATNEGGAREPQRLRAQSDWDRFRSDMRGNGLTMDQMRELYHESKNNACTSGDGGDAEAAPPTTPTRNSSVKQKQQSAASSPQGVNEFATPPRAVPAKKASSVASQAEAARQERARQHEEHERRSAAALKGWETRRANQAAAAAQVEAKAATHRSAQKAQVRRAESVNLDRVHQREEHERRSAAAKKGWETRRANQAAVEQAARYEQQRAYAQQQQQQLRNRQIPTYYGSGGSYGSGGGYGGGGGGGYGGGGGGMSWHAYRSAHKGLGMSISDMSAGYKAQR